MKALSRLKTNKFNVSHSWNMQRWGQDHYDLSLFDIMTWDWNERVKTYCTWVRKFETEGPGNAEEPPLWAMECISNNKAPKIKLKGSRALELNVRNCNVKPVEEWAEVIYANMKKCKFMSHSKDCCTPNYFRSKCLRFWLKRLQMPLLWGVKQ